MWHTKKSTNHIPVDPFPEGQALIQQQHDVAKVYSYGARLARLQQCCKEEECPEVRPKLDINTTRVASQQHTLIKTNLRIHKGHNRYVVKHDGGDARVAKLEVTQEQWKETSEMEAVLARVSQLTTIAQHERAWTGAFDLLVGRRLRKQCEHGKNAPAVHPSWW
jgi:hypothetical protein